MEKQVAYRNNYYDMRSCSNIPLSGAVLAAELLPRPLIECAGQAAVSVPGTAGVSVFPPEQSCGIIFLMLLT